MVDGLSIARELKKNHQKLFKTLTKIKVKGKDELITIYKPVI